MIYSRSVSDLVVVVTPSTRCQGSLHSMVAGHWAGLLPGHGCIWSSCTRLGSIHKAQLATVSSSSASLIPLYVSSGLSSPSCPSSKTFQISAKSLLETLQCIFALTFQISCISRVFNIKVRYLLCFMTVGSFSTKMLKIINFLIKQIEIKPFFHRNLSVSLILGFNSKFN